jgi:hypothetical protein
MIKSDKELLWRPGRLFIPAQNMDWKYEATGAAGVKSAGAGTPSATNLAYTEIGSTGIVGCLFEAAGNSVMGHTQLPYDYDRDHPMFMRVHWSSGSTDTADTILWLVQYTPIVPNVTAIIDPATALDTVIATDTVPVATANIWCTTEWGKIIAGKFAKEVEALTFEVEMDAFAGGLTEAKHLLGLELRYTPKRLQGVDGMPQAAKATTHMLGKAYGN